MYAQTLDPVIEKANKPSGYNLKPKRKAKRAVKDKLQQLHAFKEETEHMISKIEESMMEEESMPVNLDFHKMNGTNMDLKDTSLLSNHSNNLDRLNETDYQTRR